MTDDKRLRYDVLMTAIGIVDQDIYWRKENGEKVTAPETQAYIKKAKELMTFVDDTPVKISQEFLTENQVRASEDL